MNSSVTSPTSRSIWAMLRGSTLFSGVEPQLLDRLAEASFQRVIGRGEVLFRAGEVAESITLITSGLLKLVRYLPDATESILGLFGPREAVGLIAVLQERPYPATAIALSSSVTVLSVRGADVLASMKQNTTLALALNQALIYQTKILHEKIDVMSAGAVPQRLASLLLTLAERFGDELEDQTLVLPVALSRGELSSLIGARVETTIRVLSRWQKLGILKTSRDGFVLQDLAALKATQQGKDERE